MKAPRLVPWLLLALLAVPAPAAAQRAAFLKALVQFHHTLRGAYGDEGPQLVQLLDAMTLRWRRGTVRSVKRKHSSARA